MVGEDGFASVQVGNGARNLQDAVVGTGGEVEAFHGGAQEIHAVCIGLSILVEQAGGHLCVAMYVRYIGETLCLYLPGTYHTFADGGAGFAFLPFGKLLERYRNDFHLDVNAVEERTGDTVQVLLHLSGRAYAMAGRVVVIAARTQVYIFQYYYNSLIINNI